MNKMKRMIQSIFLLKLINQKKKKISNLGNSKLFCIIGCTVIGCTIIGWKLTNAKFVNVKFCSYDLTLPNFAVWDKSETVRVGPT